MWVELVWAQAASPGRLLEREDVLYPSLEVQEEDHGLCPSVLVAGHERFDSEWVAVHDQLDGLEPPQMVQDLEVLQATLVQATERLESSILLQFKFAFQSDQEASPQHAHAALALELLEAPVEPQAPT